MATTQEATTTVTPAITGKNFRHNNDVEKFYRFINDNKLQREAWLALNRVYLVIKKQSKKPKKRGRKKLQ